MPRAGTLLRAAGARAREAALINDQFSTRSGAIMQN